MYITIRVLEFVDGCGGGSASSWADGWRLGCPRSRLPYHHSRICSHTLLSIFVAIDVIVGGLGFSSCTFPLGSFLHSGLLHQTRNSNRMDWNRGVVVVYQVEESTGRRWRWTSRQLRQQGARRGWAMARAGMLKGMSVATTLALEASCNTSDLVWFGPKIKPNRTDKSWKTNL